MAMGKRSDLVVEQPLWCLKNIWEHSFRLPEMSERCWCWWNEFFQLVRGAKNDPLNENAINAIMRVPSNTKWRRMQIPDWRIPPWMKLLYERLELAIVKILTQGFKMPAYVSSPRLNSEEIKWQERQYINTIGWLVDWWLNYLFPL